VLHTFVLCCFVFCLFVNCSTPVLQSVQIRGASSNDDSNERAKIDRTRAFTAEPVAHILATFRLLKQNLFICLETPGLEKFLLLQVPEPS